MPATPGWSLVACSQVPLVTRPGMEQQIQEAMRKPGAAPKFEDIVDESIVRELDKTGFIAKVYNP